MSLAYKVELLRQAFKDYQNVPKHERENIKKAVLSLEKNPRGPQVKKLESRDYYRLRVGDWRVIFAISDKLKLVSIIAIERRTTTTY